MNQIRHINKKVKKANAYQKRLKETGELDYRMKLVKQMENGEITHKEAMQKLKEFKD